MGGKTRRAGSAHDIAYELQQDFFHYREDEVVARMMPFPGCDSYPLVLPEVVCLLANYGMLELAWDFPNNWEKWPIMSERMLACLLSVGHFAHRTTPVVMLDDRAGNDERFDADGKPVAQYMQTGWVFVELPGSLDIIDWERSVYEYLPPEVEGDPENDAMLRRLTVTAAEEELPPLFRVRGLETLLFVSRTAREALDAMDAKGIEYGSLARMHMRVELPPARRSPKSAQ